MANDILARLAVQIDAKTQQFGAALNTLSGQLNKFGASVNAQTASISNFEKRIATIQRSLGSLGIAFGAFQIGNVIVDSIRRVAEFEKQMDTVAAIAGATGEEFERLREDALRLGAASQFTATQVAELQTEFGRLGFTTDEIIAATEATIDLATATGEDLAKSADVAGSTIRAFGLSAEETGRVVDVMAESFNRTALGLDNFTQSMKFVAPVARAANISVEETTALLGVLADSGIRGSNAGTALRRIITDLAKDGRPLQERLKELAAQGLNLSGAMDEVGRFAQTALLVLTNNTDRVDELTTSFNNASGAAKETAAIMRDNLAGDTEKLTSAWDGLILSFSEGSGVIRQFIQDITSIVNILTDISNFVQGTGSDLSKLFKFIWDAGPIGATNKAIQEALGLYRDYKSELEETEKATKDLRDEEKKRAIESTVNAALTSENVEAYIRALDQNIYKEEIIAEIRRRQAEALKGQSGAISEQIGIIEALEARAKELGDAIKKATSISEIRQLQHELEGVQIRMKAILDPSIAPEPIVIPIEFDEPDLSLQEFSDRILAIQPKVVIPVEFELPPDTEDTGLTAQLEAISEELRVFSESAAEIIRNGIGNALIALGEDFGNLATGVGSFGDNILKAFADFAGQFGKLMIATAVAKIKFDALLATPGGGFILAAAGVALVAAAKAVSNHLSSAASFGASGGGGQSSYSNFERERADPTVSTVEVVVTGRIEGNDILISGSRARDRNNFTRPGG